MQRSSVYTTKYCIKSRTVVRYFTDCFTPSVTVTFNYYRAKELNGFVVYCFVCNSVVLRYLNRVETQPDHPRPLEVFVSFWLQHIHYNCYPHCTVYKLKPSDLLYLTLRHLNSILCIESCSQPGVSFSFIISWYRI